jgi:hypothetical protein
VLHLVIRKTNLPGVGPYTMSAVEQQQAIKRAAALEGIVEDYTEGMIEIDQMVVVVETTLTSATPFGPVGSYWVSPADLAAIMAANNASGYDAVIAYVSVIGVPCVYGGLTVPGLSHIPIRAGFADGSGNPTIQPMAVTHEFSHQVEGFMTSQGATDFPCVDCGHQFGYDGSDDYARFYDDWLSGDIPPPDGKPPFGISADLWRLGKPTDP